MNKQILSVGNHRAGKRIWLQNLRAKGFMPGDLIRVDIHADQICVVRDPSSKRKVSAPSKGGVLDLSNQAVTEWVKRNNAEQVEVFYADNYITIEVA